MHSRLREAGGDFSKEDINGVEVTVVRDADDENRVFGVFERENTIVVATDPIVLRGVLHHWARKAKTQAANALKRTAMTRVQRRRKIRVIPTMIQMPKIRQNLCPGARSPRTTVSRRWFVIAGGRRIRRRT